MIQYKKGTSNFRRPNHGHMLPTCDMLLWAVKHDELCGFCFKRIVIYVFIHIISQMQTDKKRLKAAAGVLDAGKNSTAVCLFLSRLVTFTMLELSCQAGMWPYLLYVFRMIRRMVRMIMIPMTMTAIIAPEPDRHRKRRGRMSDQRA